MDYPTVLSLIVLALLIIVEKVSDRLSVVALLQQPNVNVGDELLDVHILLLIFGYFALVELIHQLSIVNLLDKAGLLKGYDAHTRLDVLTVNQHTVLSGQGVTEVLHDVQVER